MPYSIVLILLNSIVVYKICRCCNTSPLLKILLGVSYYGWNALPLFYTRGLGYTDTILSNNIALYDFCNYANQLFLFFVYLIAYLLIKTQTSPNWLNRPDFQTNKTFIRKATVFCVLVVILSTIKLAISSTLYTDFDLQKVSSDASVGPYVLLSSFSRFFLLAVVFFFRNSISMRMAKYVLAILFAYYLLITITGGRINIFAIVILFLYYTYNSQHKKKYLVYFVLTSLLAFSLLPIIGNLRQSGERISVNDIVNNSNVKEDKILQEVLIKTNSVDYSTFLLSTDGIGGAGSKVYTSAIYSLVPKFLYPNKPSLGSKDGTVMGSYARFAAQAISGNADETGYNVGVSTSIVALWTLGWPMYIFQILICGYLIFIMNAIFVSRKTLFIVFILFSTNFPVCQLDLSLDVILRDIQRYFLLYLFLSYLFKNKYKNAAYNNNVRRVG